MGCVKQHAHARHSRARGSDITVTVTRGCLRGSHLARAVQLAASSPVLAAMAIFIFMPFERRGSNSRNAGPEPPYAADCGNKRPPLILRARARRARERKRGRV